MDFESPMFIVTVVGFLTWLVYVYNLFWLRPQRIRNRLGIQGIAGPPPRLFFGNILDMKKIESTAAKSKQQKAAKSLHDYFDSVFPYFELWRKAHGPVFQYATGNMSILFVGEANLAKELLQCNSHSLGRPSYLKTNASALVGHSIISSNGEAWSQQRRIIAPEFFVDKVKGMVELMIESLKPLLASWEKKVDEEEGRADIRIDVDLKKFAADVISRACFGSNHTVGKGVFHKFRDLQLALGRRSLAVSFPGLSYFPTENNRRIWRLEKEIRMSILNVMNERKSSSIGEKDLLEAMLKSTEDGTIPVGMAQNFVVDNSKGVYFAGHETTATTLAWTMVLLAFYPEWQARIRDEVQQVCEGHKLTADTLSKMKVVTMVLQESMRLYPVTPFVQREAFEDVEFGNLYLPKGTVVWVAPVLLHRDIELWGPDAEEFRPERFATGVAKACKSPQVYVPFGNGPRACIGQSLAMMEMKILISLILSNFSLFPSPHYRHSVSFRLVLEPEDGVYLVLKKIKSDK